MTKEHPYKAFYHQDKNKSRKNNRGERGRFASVFLFFIVIFIGYTAGLMISVAVAQPRIKDIAGFEGVRSNLLVGYGLVVGLSGTGDRLENSVFTRESLVGVLERLGVNANDDRLRTTNVAAVIVTALLPPFARHGATIDITISALGDSESLQGGTLLATPLVAADGQVYAVGQGTISLSSLIAPRGGLADAGAPRGVPTSGRIAGGAIVEHEINFNLDQKTEIKLALHRPDFTTARRMVLAINSFLGTDVATTTDPGTIVVRVPPIYRNAVNNLIADIEQLRVLVDKPAKVVINEHAGIVVMGEGVQISPVSISHGNLSLQVQDAAGNITNQRGAFVDLEGAATLEEVVDGLNALGIQPRDIIEILQVIHRAGALQAVIEVM